MSKDFRSTHEPALCPVGIIGAPTDAGAGTAGSRMGPAALRVAGIAAAVARYGRRVRDCGDLQGPETAAGAALRGYRNLGEVLAWVRAVHAATRAELAAGRLPLLIGGDHSLAMGSISAVAHHCRGQGRSLRVLWLDAHADFNTCEITPSGNLHGMALACLCGFGPAELTGLAGAEPALRPREIRQIGVRSVDEREKRALREHGIEVFDMRYIDEIGMRRTLELALEGLGAHTHLHVSLDIDFIDPDIAPGVATAVRGGPTYRETQLCMEMIADTGRLGSLDIVELNPVFDVRNGTAELAVDLVESLFGKSTLLRMRGA
jgi:arginase